VIKLSLCNDLSLICLVGWFRLLGKFNIRSNQIFSLRVLKSSLIYFDLVQLCSSRLTFLKCLKIDFWGVLSKYFLWAGETLVSAVEFAAVEFLTPDRYRQPPTISLERLCCKGFINFLKSRAFCSTDIVDGFENLWFSYKELPRCNHLKL
jgi:hypothetical protein